MARAEVVEPGARRGAGAGGGGLDWRRAHLLQIQAVRDLLVLAAVVGVVYLGYKLSVVTVPLLLALLLAYLFEPLVRWVRWKTRASRAFIASAIIVLAGLIVVVPLGVGLVYGIAQGVTFISGTVTNVDRLVRSVNRPEEAGLRAQLPTDAWRDVRDWYVREEERYRHYNPDLEPDAGPDAGAEGGAESAPAAEGQSGTGGAVREGGADAPADAARGGAASGGSGSGGAGSADAGGDALAAEAAVVQTPEGEVVEPEGAPVPRPGPVFELVRRVEPWVEENLARIGQQALSLGADALTVGVRAATTLGVTLFGAFLTAFFFFFFCTGYGRLLEFWEQLIPERRKWRVFHLLHQMDRVIAAFVRGRLTIAVVLMVYYSVAYWLAGVPAPLVVGTVIGAAVLIPYFASVSMPVVALLLWLGPNEGFRAEWWWILGAPVVIFAIAQVVDDYILNPIIQGKATDMNTPAILFASIAGGVLAGFYGLLLAIPVAACIKILLREVFWPKFRAWAQGRESDFLPVERE